MRRSEKKGTVETDTGVGHTPCMQEERGFGGEEDSESEEGNSDVDYDMEEEDQSEEEPCEFDDRYLQMYIYVYM